MARLDDERLPYIMLGARRSEGGSGSRGCHGESLMGVYGRRGVFSNLIGAHLTSEARRKYFEGSRGSWMELAESRKQWKNFVASVKLN